MPDVGIGVLERDVLLWYASETPGVFYSMSAEVPAMLAAGGGAIVNISSTGGLRAFDGLGAYVASKHAVSGLTRSAALENIRGIRVNAVAPGMVHTPMLAGLSQQEIDAYAATVPSGRLGTAEEIANVVAFLLSDEASFVTGAVVPVEGSSWSPDNAIGDLGCRRFTT